MAPAARVHGRVLLSEGSEPDWEQVFLGVVERPLEVDYAEVLDYEGVVDRDWVLDVAVFVST